ncbi:GNAT family N-acetyltransferase [Streptomyces sp. TRM 70351]|uniref:GNAT family N-acetyltransferase n=1 Tax=Streptomyces sp. TRM 70351 TaxID=3116552 RepID=UPI002E7C550E|nr:GNAT family N-acetyltransferase [Streptomyces sp. TRM 70351]MEE1927266.1 GNAT family N-acetyltransferase [Streptomyces sp. TRM 70351]
MRVRAGEPADLPHCQDVERAAGEPFRELGMAAVADDEPPPLAALEDVRGAGLLWVAAGGSGHGPVLGYLMAEPVDGCTHVEQVSVHPGAARRGIGRALIDHAQAATGAPLTLTTFRDVPWNAPYYARLGFVRLPKDAWTPGLRRIRAHERALGLERWPRVCMRRDTAPARLLPGVSARDGAGGGLGRDGGRGQSGGVVGP